MVRYVGNLVVQLSSNPGNGPFGLATVPAGRQSFTAAGFVNLDTPFYFAFLPGQQVFEWGIGTLSVGASATLSRTTVLGNSNGKTSPVNFNGIVTVTNEIPVEYLLFKDVTGNAVDVFGNRLWPIGIISLWYGSIASIPAGWALCNGANGTPDLRDMFAIGAGNSFAPGATGGATSATGTTSGAGAHSHGGQTGSSPYLPLTGAADTQGAHSHSGVTGGFALTTNEIPAHTHGLGLQIVTVGSGGGAVNLVIPQASSGWNSAYISATGNTGSNLNGASHNHSISTDGAHSHNIIVSAVPTFSLSISTDGAHNHTVTVATVPPYYALAYIMKL